MRFFPFTLFRALAHMLRMTGGEGLATTGKVTKPFDIHDILKNILGK